MLPKPPSCASCPLYQDGRGYVPDKPCNDAEVAIVAQSPGADEEAGLRVVGVEYVGHRRVPQKEPNPTGPAPLIGMTGYDMERDFFPLAGLQRSQVSLHNVLKCRWAPGGRRTNDMPSGKLLEQAVAHCTQAHMKIPGSVRLLVTMGAHAARWAGCPGSITEWRGFTFPMEAAA